MHVQSISRAALGVLALGLVWPFFGQVGCSKTSQPASVQATDELAGRSPSKQPPSLGVIPDFELIDHDGRAFDQSKLDGHLTVVNFFFTRCTATCPKQSQEIARLQNRFSDEDAVRFLSISVQPSTDTPEVLTRYAKSFAANPQRWSFVTGDRGKIWKLSGEGFKLPVGNAPQDGTSPIFHSSKFVLVDAERRIRGFYESASPDEVATLVSDIRELIPSTNNRTSANLASNVGGESALEVEADSIDPSVSDLELQLDKEFTAREPDNDANAPSLSNLEQQLENASTAIAPPDVRDIFVPSRKDVIPDWLVTRRDSQLAQRALFDVFHDFQFRDRLPESGIQWENRVVEDAGKTYIAAHYDHGNGVAIADIDSDGLYDIYFTSQIGTNALYRNLGNGTFDDVTAKTGVGLSERVSVTASFADFDNDGDADLFVSTVRGGNVLFRNDGDLRFTDVTRQAGLEYVGHSSAAVFFDFDRDGLLDLFVTNVGQYTTDEKGVGGYYRSLSHAFAGHLKPELTETSILYKNLDGQRFEDVTAKMRLLDDSWSGDATPIDANDDGWIDLYTLDMQGHDEYFENIGGKAFAKRSREVFPKTPWGAMGVKVFDFDNDGRMDLYITDMHSDMSQDVGIEQEKLKADMQWSESMLQSGGQSIWGNALFHKQPDGSYEEVSDAMGAENYWPWGMSVGDLNADGFEDVFIASSMNLPLRYGINSVLLNNLGKKFLDSEFIVGVEPRRNGISAKPWFTLDCDGADRDHKYAKQAGITSGKVVVWSALGSRSSVIFDFDNDGDLDIVTNDFNSPPMILESNLAERYPVRFLKVQLVGKESNRDGLGAVVEVVTDRGSYKKVHDGQSGYLSQSSHQLYFGLDDATKVTEVRIAWPSGTKQVIRPTEMNNVLVVVEGSP